MAAHGSRRDFLRGGLAAAGALALGPLPGARAAEAPADAPRPRFHYGLVTYTIAANMDLPTVIDLCEKTGMEGVELRSTHKHGVEPSLDAAGREKVKEAFAKTKVRLVGLGSACEFHSPDPAVVKKNIEQTRAFVQLAADLGAWGVKVRPNGLPKGVPEEKTLRQIGEAVRECADFAKDKGVFIYVECHGSGTSHPPRMAKIMEFCNHPSAGLCWNCNGGDVKDRSIREYFELCKPWVRHAHIHDLADGYPHKELFEFLKAMNFDGYTVYEGGCKGDPVPFLSAQRALWEKMAV